MSLSLYLKTELRAFTESFGSCERLFIRLSVMPSDKYSTSALPLALINGMTAIDSICDADAGRLAKNHIPRTAAATKNIVVNATAGLCRLIPDAINSALDIRVCAGSRLWLSATI